MARRPLKIDGVRDNDDSSQWRAVDKSRKRYENINDTSIRITRNDYRNIQAREKGLYSRADIATLNEPETRIYQKSETKHFVYQARTRDIQQFIRTVINTGGGGKKNVFATVVTDDTEKRKRKDGTIVEQNVERNTYLFTATPGSVKPLYDDIMRIIAEYNLSVQYIQVSVIESL